MTVTDGSFKVIAAGSAGRPTSRPYKKGREAATPISQLSRLGCLAINARPANLDGDVEK
jgi:hypothetical protein